MFKIDARYSEYYDANDPQYPGGKAVPATTPDSIDGTNWRSLFFNDLHGARQALFIAAFGSLKKISGQPDNAEKSDMLNAILELIQKSINHQYFVKNITGEETVIPLEDLKITFNPEKQYFIFVSPHGNFREFLPFGAEIKESGLHIFAQRLMSGQLVPGTRIRKWGQGKWGQGKWGEYGTMPVNILIKEL